MNWSCTAALTKLVPPVGSDWVKEARDLLVERHLNRPDAADVLPGVIDDEHRLELILRRSTDPELQARVCLRLSVNAFGQHFGALVDVVDRMTAEEFESGLRRATELWRRCLTEFDNPQFDGRARVTGGLHRRLESERQYLRSRSAAHRSARQEQLLELLDELLDN